MRIGEGLFCVSRKTARWRWQNDTVLVFEWVVVDGRVCVL